MANRQVVVEIGRFIVGILILILILVLVLILIVILILIGILILIPHRECNPRLRLERHVDLDLVGE